MMVNRRLALIISLLLLIAVSSFAVETAFWPQQEKYFDRKSVTYNSDETVTVEGLFNYDNDKPVRVFGGNLNANINSVASLSDINNFIDNNTDIFNVKSENLEVLHFGIVGNKYYFTARQRVNGRPVLQSRVLIRMGESGKVLLWGADVEEDKDNIWSSALSPELAALTVADFVRIEEYQILSIDEIWVRTDNGLLSAYQVAITGIDPFERPFALVNANNGEILGYYNDAMTDEISGNIQGPVTETPHTTPQLLDMPYQRVSVGNSNEYTDNDGNYEITDLITGQMYNFSMSLEGQFANVSNDNGPDAAYTDDVFSGTVYNPVWEAGVHGRQDEFTAFYHVNFIHSFYGDLDPGFTDLNYSVPTVVNYGNNLGNAFWGGFGMFLGAGDGQVANLGLSASVIYHEYTHGVTGNIYPNGTLPYEGQSGALNEAWSDYFPCSIFNDSGMGRGFYVTSPTQPLRELDNNRRFPENWVGEVHSDGLIPGGAMWHTREQLDYDYADSLMHFAKYGLGEDFQSYFIEVLVYDDDNDDLSDGTPHGDVIYEQFARHGIGPGADPELVILDLEIIEEVEDGFFMPGETITITFDVENDVMLYPPPAENVTVIGQAADGIEWTVGEVVIGDIAAGATVQLPQDLTFTVNADAEVQYSDISFDIVANNGDYSIDWSRTIVLGQPSMLMVNDSGDQLYLDRFVDYTREMDKVAYIWDTDELATTASSFDNYDIIIWFTGNRQNPISTGEAEELEVFIGNGGNLILTGQYIGPNINMMGSFAHALGVQITSQTSGVVAIQGITGQPLSEGLLAALSGDDSPTNQVSPSVITTWDDAEPLYNYLQTTDVAAVWNPGNDNTGDVAYFGFGLEAVSGISGSTRASEMLEPIINYMMGVDVEEDDDVTQRPIEYNLSKPWPNPFNPSTSVSLSLPETADVKLAVYNLLGQQVMQVVNGKMQAGEHQLTIDMSNFASGIYLVRVDSQFGTRVNRLALIK